METKEWTDDDGMGDGFSLGKGSRVLRQEMQSPDFVAQKNHKRRVLFTYELQHRGCLKPLKNLPCSQHQQHYPDTTGFYNDLSKRILEVLY